MVNTCSKSAVRTDGCNFEGDKQPQWATWVWQNKRPQTFWNVEDIVVYCSTGSWSSHLLAHGRLQLLVAVLTCGGFKKMVYYRPKYPKVSSLIIILEMNWDIWGYLMGLPHPDVPQGTLLAAPTLFIPQFSRPGLIARAANKLETKEPEQRVDPRFIAPPAACSYTTSGFLLDDSILKQVARGSHIETTWTGDGTRVLDMWMWYADLGKSSFGTSWYC